MQKSFIGRGYFLQPYQQPPRAVQPRMEAFHDPTTRPLLGISAPTLSPLLATWAHMGKIASRSDRFLCAFPGIAGIQTEMLWWLFGGRWSLEDDRVQGHCYQVRIMYI